MARIVITRPNGETEYAALTTDKNLAGNDRLAVEKAGTVYYAKLGNGVSTHMYVIQPDGRKLYVQKEVKFVWKYNFDRTWETASKMVIPRNGRYELTYYNSDYDTEDIFKMGDKFIRINNQYWHIKGKTADHDNFYVEDWNENPDIPEGEEETYYIKSIEYIGPE